MLAVLSGGGGFGAPPAAACSAATAAEPGPYGNGTLAPPAAPPALPGAGVIYGLAGGYPLAPAPLAAGYPGNLAALGGLAVFELGLGLRGLVVYGLEGSALYGF